MTRLRALLQGGLSATAALWPDVEAAYDWVFRAAAILADLAGRTGVAVQARYRGLLGAMARHEARSRRSVDGPEDGRGVAMGEGELATRADWRTAF